MAAETCIIGGGSWGTALAITLASKGGRVKLWVYEAELVETIKEERVNAIYLPGFEIPQNIEPTASLEEAVAGCRVVLNVVPSHAMRSVWPGASRYLSECEMVLSATKGIENETLMTMDEVLKDVLPSSLHRRLAFLSGPTFARDVAAGKPAAATVASEDHQTAKAAQELLSTSRFRLYTNPDVKGVVLGGAFKNVIAIAAGISDGLGLGDNARAALITRGLAEMTRLGVKMGAHQATFSGLAGIGDLVLTCSGGQSRNRTVGCEIGKGRKLTEILGAMKMVAEGVKTAKSVMGLMEKHDVDLPIAHKTYSILYEGEDPASAVMELMTRSLKGEIEYSR
jgi:glycerol-3-phosphate dehydrogenase (NAD(P)+)